jgi:hypothetical protein
MRRLLLLATLGLAACSGPGGTQLGSYVGGSIPVECAPFARALSGVRLSGAAADWWWQAQGVYARGTTPEVGSVLVLRRSSRLPFGHVGVVSRVVSARQVLMTQANWVHHRVTEDQPVIDVSPDGDWSIVRMWWPPAGEMGVTEYPAYGFIGSGRPVSHDGLVEAVAGAIRVAMSGG